MKSFPFVGALALAVLAPFARAQQAEPEAGFVALHQALLDARTDAVVLNVAAHPDDEASRTNTILRRKYGMRVVTAYTTYGDGGQNAIGREIGPELAYLRVRETLRAAAMSDVEVRWLGMEDFGFSKTLDETRRPVEAPARTATDLPEDRFLNREVSWLDFNARVLALAAREGYRAWRSGTVLSDGGRKAVEIVPLGLTFAGDSLHIR
jgi:LmbE family N-acetylglucosaminyl deacetylase